MVVSRITKAVQQYLVRRIAAEHTATQTAQNVIHLVIEKCMLKKLISIVFIFLSTANAIASELDDFNCEQKSNAELKMLTRTELIKFSCDVRNNIIDSESAMLVQQKSILKMNLSEANKDVPEFISLKKLSDKKNRCLAIGLGSIRELEKYGLKLNSISDLSEDFCRK